MSDGAEIANLDQLFDADDLAPAEEFDPTTDLDAEAEEPDELDAEAEDAAPDAADLDAEDDDDDPDADASASGEDEDAEADDESADDAAAMAELARLRALAAEAEQLRHERDRAQRAQQEAQAAAYWQQRDQTIAAQYDAALVNLRQLAEQAVDPAAYLTTEIQRLNTWRLQEDGKVRAAREQAIWSAHQREQAVAYFRQVVQHYDLSADEAREVAALPAAHYEAKAAQLRQRRDEIAALRDRADKAERKIAARRLANNGVGPGRGRATSKTVKPGSREHLALLLG